MKNMLELGGSDPFIVLGDADLDAASAAVVGRMNAGRFCTASKRFIIVDEVFDDFVGRFAQAMRAYVAGDLTDPRTLTGPLSSEDTRGLVSIVDDAVSKGLGAQAAHRLVALEPTSGNDPRGCNAPNAGLP